MNNEGSCRTKVDYIVAFQLLGEQGRTDELVPANVDSFQEDHERHGSLLLEGYDRDLPFSLLPAIRSRQFQNHLPWDSEVSWLARFSGGIRYLFATRSR